jgi:hypothetical protein
MAQRGWSPQGGKGFLRADDTDHVSSILYQNIEVIPYCSTPMDKCVLLRVTD